MHDAVSHEPVARLSEPDGSSSQPGIIILGAGMSGLCMAIQLKRAGFENFVILEKSGGLGGTWWDNTYPGAQCDVPAHLYSYSFEPNPNWSRIYAPQEEIRRYMESCAAKFGILPHLRLNTEVTQAHFNARHGRWEIVVRGGETLHAAFFICSTGPLSMPRYPDIAGMNAFSGRVMHTSRWDHSYDMAGKSVAVIGTAASAVQLIPQIAQRARQVTVFQRTPNWIIPRRDRAFTERQKRWLRNPLIGRSYRVLLYWQREMQRLSFNHGTLPAKLAVRMAEQHLRRHVPDPALRQVLRPDYQFGCKRVLVSDDYYPALMQPNVALITTRISHITPDGVMTADGALHAADAIVCATGFNVTGLAAMIDFRGQSGQSLGAAWSEGAQAYHGMTVADFPNFFLLLGPNTGTGHTSTLLFVEPQVKYVIRCIKELMQRKKATLMVKQEAMASHNRSLQERLSRSVWGSGCSSWYMHSNGRVEVIYPGFSFQYRKALRRVDFSDYEFL